MPEVKMMCPNCSNEENNHKDYFYFECGKCHYFYFDLRLDGG